MKKININLKIWFLVCAFIGIFIQNTDASDLLVGSYLTNQVLRYDRNTGDFISVFSQNPAFQGPGGMAFGSDGNLYVVSQGNNSVVRFDGRTGAFIDVFVPSGSGGLLYPGFLTFGPDGNLYVGSMDTDQILRYDGQTGDFMNVFVEGNNLQQPVGMAFTPDGTFIVASYRSHQVLRFDGQTGAYIDEFIGSDFLLFPLNLAFGSDGQLYVSTQCTISECGIGNPNPRVSRFDGQTGAFIDVFFSIRGGGSISASGMIFGPDNNLYVSNFSTNQIFRHSGTTGAFIDVFVPTGSGGLEGANLMVFFPDLSSPLITLTDPLENAPNVPVDTNVEVHVTDTGSGVDLSTVLFTLNGIVAYDGSNPGAHPDTTVTGDRSAYQLIYNPPADFDNEIVVNVTVSGSDQGGNSTTADFSFQTEAAAGNPWDPVGDEDRDGILNGEEDANGNGVVDPGETDPSRKTLFVRPNKVNYPALAVSYWPRFLELFPSARAGFAEIPALSAAGIEVVVIGDPRHSSYNPDWANFFHNPAAPGTQRPTVDIMEVLYYDENFASCSDFSDCEKRDGHIYFDNGLGPNSSGIPHWLFDIMGYTPGSPQRIHGYNHRYRTPRVYQKVIDNYLSEGIYAQLAEPPPDQLPATTDCSIGPCDINGTKDVSPFNLLDGEGGPVFSGAPDDSAEFNDLAFDSSGRPTHVGTNDKKRYFEDDIMRRTLVHEIGHGLHVEHDGDEDNAYSANPYCIMNGLVPNWELLGHDAQPLYGFGSRGVNPSDPGGPQTECEHSPGNSADIRLPADPAGGRGVYNSVH